MRPDFYYSAKLSNGLQTVDEALELLPWLFSPYRNKYELADFFFELNKIEGDKSAISLAIKQSDDPRLFNSWIRNISAAESLKAVTDLPFDSFIKYYSKRAFGAIMATKVFDASSRTKEEKEIFYKATLEHGEFKTISTLHEGEALQWFSETAVKMLTSGDPLLDMDLIASRADKNSESLVYLLRRAKGLPLAAKLFFVKDLGSGFGQTKLQLVELLTSGILDGSLGETDRLLLANSVLDSLTFSNVGSTRRWVLLLRAAASHSDKSLSSTAKRLLKENSKEIKEWLKLSFDYYKEDSYSTRSDIGVVFYAPRLFPEITKFFNSAAGKKDVGIFFALACLNLNAISQKDEGLAFVKSRLEELSALERADALKQMVSRTSYMLEPTLDLLFSEAEIRQALMASKAKYVRTLFERCPKSMIALFDEHVATQTDVFTFNSMVKDFEGTVDVLFRTVAAL